MNSKLFQFAVSVFLMVGSCIAGFAQERAKTNSENESCTIDLTLPGTMSDIVSNVLLLEFRKDEPTVFRYLEEAKHKHSHGDDLANAAAKDFQIAESELFEWIQKYKHINCTHMGGGEFKVGKASPPKSISSFAQNVLTHVVLHELGHALVREFDLPILGNEETLADAFATHYTVSHLPESAFAILESRIESLMIEAHELPRAEWTVKGEHNSDARRAYQIAAIAIAYDANKYSSLSRLVKMTDAEKRKAVDYGSEVHRSWRRILQPLRMPANQKSNEARLVVSHDSSFSSALKENSRTHQLESILRDFDWHSQVTLRFSEGEGGAGWSRSKRTIKIHDEYIQRFIDQGNKLETSH